MHKILIIILCILPISLWGQNLPFDQDSSSLVVRLSGDAIASRTLDVEHSSTAIVIKSENYLGLSIPISINGNTLNVPLDPDAPEYTYFLSHGMPGTEIGLPVFSPDVAVYLINSGIAPTIKSTRQREEDTECVTLFNSITQSTWRAGLPSPNYSRIETSVEHVVIHHSAGSNTNTNFTQVVRDIYIYHTQVNGWSDIGYNYLIAQNGSIYDGRDPGSIDQDNVLGAHFCGSNSTTMGVCLLGNYETVQLTDPSYISLLSVLSWKLDKEDLEPYSQNQHSLGYFDAIIGHRDGCSTLCPGENVYARISDIKEDVFDQLNCVDPPANTLSFQVSEEAIEARRTITVNNSSSGYDSYQWNFEGGIPEQANWVSSGVVNYNYPGVFDITLIGLSDGVRDTLIREDYIVVRGDVVVFPNPIGQATRLAIQHHQDILGVRLLSMDGIDFPIDPDLDGKYKLPLLEPGIYMLRIETPSGIVGRKMILNY